VLAAPSHVPSQNSCMSNICGNPSPCVQGWLLLVWTTGFDYTSPAPVNNKRLPCVPLFDILSMLPLSLKYCLLSPRERSLPFRWRRGASNGALQGNAGSAAGSGAYMLMVQISLIAAGSAGPRSTTTQRVQQFHTAATGFWRTKNAQRHRQLLSPR
jgi:hypothetical protein